MSNSSNYKLLDYILAMVSPEKSNPQLVDITTKAGKLSAFTKEIVEFLDKIPGGFFIYRADEEETLLYANQALLHIFGCSSMDELREITHNSFKGIVHPDDLEAVEESIEKQIAESQLDLDYVEYRITRKDGAIRWIEDYGHFVHDEEIGDLFYVFVNDSTEKIQNNRQERERMLSQSVAKEKQLQDIIEEYDHERSIINQAHLRRLQVIEGLSTNYESVLHVNFNTNVVVPYRLSVRTRPLFEKDLVPRDYNDFVNDYLSATVHPDDIDLMRECFSEKHIRQKLNEAGSMTQNYRCIHNGELQQIQIRVVNVNSPSSVVIGFLDITEQIQHETRQREILEDALAKAQHAANVKSVFLANMSHDMRTPLNAIYGYIKLARTHLDDPEHINEYLKKIEVSSGNILELVENVLEASNAESQNNSVNEVECNIVEIVEDVCKKLQPKASRKDIKIVQNCAGIRNADVYADSDKVSQIVWQLLDNAIKFSMHGNSVSITATEAGTTLGGLAKFHITVTDNGLGIGENMLPHIFEPFEREYNTTAIGEFGSGLGLTVANNFATMMGGRIDVTSAVGKGSTFTVNLDLRVQEKHEEVDISALVENLKDKKILIVDDNEINLEIESELLQEIGLQTEAAENGQVAIEKLTASPEDYYAVILMDIQMPIMDGWKATEIIRKMDHPYLSEIPIIAVSANSFESDKRTSLKCGMDAHIAKPMDVQELLVTMSNIFVERQKRKK